MRATKQVCAPPKRGAFSAHINYGRGINSISLVGLDLSFRDFAVKNPDATL
jgi:hypothetical protein